MLLHYHYTYFGKKEITVIMFSSRRLTRLKQTSQARSVSTGWSHDLSLRKPEAIVLQITDFTEYQWNFTDNKFWFLCPVTESRGSRIKKIPAFPWLSKALATRRLKECKFQTNQDKPIIFSHQSLPFRKDRRKDWCMADRSVSTSSCLA